MFLIFLTRIARLFSHMLKRFLVDIFFHYREWKYLFNHYLCAYRKDLWRLPWNVTKEFVVSCPVVMSLVVSTRK